MKKILILLILLFGAVGFTSNINANDNKTLVVHYYRYDNNYTSFNIWLWENLPVAGDGIQFDFSQSNVDEKGAYLEVSLTEKYPGATRLGIIIKRGASWDGYQEIGGDRFFNLSEVEEIDGKYHVYFVEQDINIGKSQADLANNIPDYRDKVINAYFNTSKNVVATFTKTPIRYEILENNEIIKTEVPTSKTINVNIGDVVISNHYEVRAHFENQHVHTLTVSIQDLYDTKEFEDAYTYDGQLGVSFVNNQTIFRLWAPLSQAVTLNLYHQGHENYDNSGKPSEEKTPYKQVQLVKIENGAWEAKLDEDVSFKYYTFTVENSSGTFEVVDPYAYSTGVNGTRGMIVDFSKLNPEGWVYNARPNTVVNPVDYIVYELHVRDLTSHSSWRGPDQYRGKFLGMAETNTKYTNKGVTVTTGLDHIAELGVNAVQLLPIFDFGYIDEVRSNDPTYDKIFNWGYMPYNFNTLEGSYSTNPFDGRIRIEEFKKTVMAFHDYDIRLIMDVVYNHTGESEGSNFHKILPGYYFRHTETGGFSNGSGTGNETASERSMMRKFMVDSTVFWATEYNLSGFRFDLMALHDVETMNAISNALHEIDPTIIVYGEPWNGGSTPLPSSLAADKGNIKNLENVGAFNDFTRDAIKGSVFYEAEGAWIQNHNPGNHVNNIKYGIVGGIAHSGVTGVSAWHLDPNKTINYVEAHDNNTLHDKLRLTKVPFNKLSSMQIQANAIILTSQGVPFLHAGAEIMRSKPLKDGGYDHNSYESPDSVNQIRWDEKITNIHVFEYYKTLIQIRKTYPQFRMSTAADIQANLKFLPTSDNVHAIAYEISDSVNGDVIVLHTSHPKGDLAYVDLNPNKEYIQLTSYDQATFNGIATIKNRAYSIGNSTVILVEKKPDLITINQNLIEIDPLQPFNPLDNVTIVGQNITLSASTYQQTQLPGYYTVTVKATDTNGYSQLLYYTLRVRGNNYRVELGG